MDRTARERIGDAYGDARQPLELLGQAGILVVPPVTRTSRSASEPALALVELERGDHLVREGLQLGDDGGAGART